MADQPKYVESLRDEIAHLDGKIDNFNEKFDQKIDRLNENLHEVESALTEVSTTLKTFIQRVDRTGDRQWQLFMAVIGLTATFLVAAAASFWQVQQHGKQLEHLETAITRLDESIAKVPSLEHQIGRLEKSVEKIAGLETTIVRLDQSFALHGRQLEKLDKSMEKLAGVEATMVRLDQSLALHGRQLEKLEKSVEKIAGLEIAITRLEGSVTRLADQEKTLDDLADSIKESLTLSRRMERRLAEIEFPGLRPHRGGFYLQLGPGLANQKPSARPNELEFEWQLEPDLANRLKPGQKFQALIPSQPKSWVGAVPKAEVIRQGDRTILRLRVEFPNHDAAEATRKVVTDPNANRQEVLIVPDDPG